MPIKPVRRGPRHHVAGMREHKTAATTAGILYIIGTVAGVLSVVVSAPVRDARDPLAAAADHSGAVVTAALLVLVMGLSLAFVAVVLFPVLRRIDEVLAIGYLIVRGAVETACYVVIAIGWLLLVPLGKAISAGSGTTASPAGVHVGSLVTDFDAANAVLALVFCLGAVMFYFLLYRSRIVPRWIALWGLVAIPFYVAAYLVAMYADISAVSPKEVLLFPLQLQEMVLAVWMIARGFRPAAVSTTSELAPANGQRYARLPS